MTASFCYSARLSIFIVTDKSSELSVTVYITSTCDSNLLHDKSTVLTVKINEDLNKTKI